MDISKVAFEHLANSLYEYITCEGYADMSSAYRIAFNFSDVLSEEAHFIRENWEDDEDKEYSKKMLAIADYLEEVDTAEAVKAVCQELKNFGDDSADAFGLLIKALNS